MGFEPSKEGTLFVKISIRFWIRISSRKQTEVFWRYFRRIVEIRGGVRR